MQFAAYVYQAGVLDVEVNYCLLTVALMSIFVRLDMRHL